MGVIFQLAFLILAIFSFQAFGLSRRPTVRNQIRWFWIGIFTAYGASASLTLLFCSALAIKF